MRSTEQPDYLSGISLGQTNKMSTLCSICQNNFLYLKGLHEFGENSEKIVEKLQKCVPEVIDWGLCFGICNSCLTQLENVCQFRDLCVKSYAVRKNKTEREEKQLELSELPVPDIKNEFTVLKSQSLPSEVTFTENAVSENSMKEENMIPTITEKPCKVPKQSKKCASGQGGSSTICNICDICGTSFGNIYLLKRHIRNVHATEKLHKCELCESRFASSVYLNAHKRYHSGERTHICVFCGKGYITASDLYHHEKIHANKRAYRCHICPKAFNTSSDLHKHKICVHLDRTQWKYECSFCQRRFPLKTNLDTHTKTHTGERNFLCHLCDRKCISKSVLKRHIESHSMAKSYKCTLCLQGYKYKKSLDIHMAKVHRMGEAKIPERVKKYFCNLCPKSYFANNKLQKHIRSHHTGEKPFGCPACDKYFIDKSYIKQHLKLAHNIVT